MSFCTIFSSRERGVNHLESFEQQGEAREPEEEPQPAAHGGDDGYRVVNKILTVAKIIKKL